MSPSDPRFFLLPPPPSRLSLASSTGGRRERLPPSEFPSELEFHCSVSKTQRASSPPSFAFLSWQISALQPGRTKRACLHLASKPNAPRPAPARRWAGRLRSRAARRPRSPRSYAAPSVRGPPPPADCTAPALLRQLTASQHFFKNAPVAPTTSLRSALGTWPMVATSLRQLIAPLTAPQNFKNAPPANFTAPLSETLGSDPPSTLLRLFLPLWRLHSANLLRQLTAPQNFKNAPCGTDDFTAPLFKNSRSDSPLSPSRAGPRCRDELLALRLLSLESRRFFGRHS